jgi:hypothetical protein
MKTEEPTGVKFDSAKPDYSLIPPNALDDVAKVLTYGAKKYDRENWRKLDDLDNRYFAAAQRHIWAVKKGEPNDPETGISHLAHAIASLMFLVEHDYEKKAKKARSTEMLECLKGTDLKVLKFVDNTAPVLTPEQTEAARDRWPNPRVNLTSRDTVFPTCDINEIGMGRP